jgi:hypothetical protein
MNNNQIRGELTLAKLNALEKIAQGHALIKAGENELSQAMAGLRVLDKTEKSDVDQ